MDNNAVKDKIKTFPDLPGVYEFLNKKGEVIYVGKAKNLKRRAASYFQDGKPNDRRLELLKNETCDVKFISASSESEAFIYEAGLIKDLAPKYNIELKDDKSYPFLKLTTNEKYPCLFITRRRMNDGAVYYGPYADAKLLKEAVSFMKTIFPLRTCRVSRKTVCLEYHIGQCLAPCEGKYSDDDYGKVVCQLKNFLEGKKEKLIRSLEKDMIRYSKKKEYEKALFAKKQIKALTAVNRLYDRARHPMYGELDELKNILSLSHLPIKIECFDVSNISGQEAVGAMVKFVSGLARKTEYRKFRIKTVKAIDDYSMIREVVTRRYSRLIREGKTLPDLVLIDGGKGHLSVVRCALDKLGLGTIPAASIAKEFNHLYIIGRKYPIRLSPGSRVLFLIQRVRDEAHRFAINYHRHLRRKKISS